jgi:hypothetical protein
VDIPVDRGPRQYPIRFAAYAIRCFTPGGHSVDRRHGRDAHFCDAR